MRLRFGLVVACLAVASLAVGYAWKDECTHTPWHEDWQYTQYCYNDILPLWFAGEMQVEGKTLPSHDLEHDKVPFADTFTEYPVGTAFFMYGVAKATTGLTDYMELTFVLLTLAGAAATYALWRLDMPRSRMLAWVLFPTLIIHGLVNWDLLAVALAAWGWVAWRSKRPMLSAFLLGLGGATKIYPAFFLPFLLLAALRERDRQSATRVAIGGTLGLVVPNFLVALAAYGNWISMWQFQAHRAPDFETPWASALEPFVHWLGRSDITQDQWTGIAGYVGIAAMTAGTLWMGWRVWRHRLDALAAGGVLTIVFLLVNKVYSPQYTLWALPILLLLRANWLPLGLFVAADTANFFVRYQYIGNNGWHDQWQPWSQLCVDLRWLALLWAGLSILVRCHALPDLWAKWRPQRKDAATPGGAAP